jgi:hypothetical protein
MPPKTTWCDSSLQDMAHEIIDWSCTTRGDLPAQPLLSRFEIQQRGTKPSAQDVLVPLVKKLTAQGKKVLIFRNMRGKAEGCAQYLARDLWMLPVSEAINQIPWFGVVGRATSMPAGRHSISQRKPQSRRKRSRGALLSGPGLSATCSGRNHNRSRGNQHPRLNGDHRRTRVRWRGWATIHCRRIQEHGRACRTFGIQRRRDIDHSLGYSRRYSPAAQPVCFRFA